MAACKSLQYFHSLPESNPEGCFVLVRKIYRVLPQECVARHIHLPVSKNINAEE